MRFLFNLFAFLSAMSLLLLGASLFIETRSGYINFQFSGTTMTVNVSGLDRILLVLSLVFGILTIYLWQRITGRG